MGKAMKAMKSTKAIGILKKVQKHKAQESAEKSPAKGNKSPAQGQRSLAQGQKTRSIHLEKPMVT